MEDLFVLTPDFDAKPNEALQALPDGLITPHIIRSIPPTHTAHNTFIIEGIQKLVQEVWLEIISERTPDGSGSGFKSALLSSTANEQELQQLSRQYLSLIQENIVRSQAAFGKLPLIETLLSLRLLRIRLDGNQFIIDIQLKTQAGLVTVANYTIPRSR